MLSTRPIIKVSQTQSTTEYIKIFMQIDSDSGPMDLQYINSLQDFYIKYNSYRKTTSYNLAELLLKYGYSLELLRVNSANNYSSLMLTDNPNLYTYPEKDKEYIGYDIEGISDEVVNTDSNKIYGFNLIIPSDGLIEGDYILININKSHWFYIHNGINSKVSTNVYYRTYDMRSENSYIDKNTYNNFINDPRNPKYCSEALAELLRTKTGIDTSIMENEDGSYTIECSTSHLQVIPEVSVSEDSRIKFIINDNLNYDIITKYLINRKSIEFYSKYDSSINDLECTINKLGRSFIDGKYYYDYSITINKLDINGNVIHSELFSISTKNDISYNENLINLNSQLVTCKITDLSNLPNGSWLFGRKSEMEDATIDNFYSSISLRNGIDPTKFIDSDIILDAGIDTSKLTIDESDTYKKYIDKLSNLLSNKILISSYIDDYNYRLISDLIFQGRVLVENKELPSYIALFYLLSTNKDFEGELPFNYTSIEDNNQVIYNSALELGLNTNVLTNTNYRLILKNPIGYFNKSDITSANLIKIVVGLNYVVRYVKDLNVTSNSDAIGYTREAIEKLSNYFNSPLAFKIKSAEIKDRLLTINLEVDITDIYKKDFNLIIDITQSS